MQTNQTITLDLAFLIRDFDSMEAFKTKHVSINITTDKKNKIVKAIKTIGMLSDRGICSASVNENIILVKTFVTQKPIRSPHKGGSTKRCTN